MMKGLLAQEPWLYDSQVVELPWRDEHEAAVLRAIKSQKKGGKLSFGLLCSDGLVNPQPPIRRALSLMENLVKKLGHEIVEWKPPSHIRVLDIAVIITTLISSRHIT
jgi:amidase